MNGEREQRTKPSATWKALGMLGIPPALVTWILYVRRCKPLPSLAFICTVVIGSAILYFCAAVSVEGLQQGPIDWMETAGGLMAITLLTLPFFIAAWLLWIRPVIGAILLICIGAGMGWFFEFDWQHNDSIAQSALIIVPVVLGLFKLIAELVRGKQDNQAVGSA